MLDTKEKEMTENIQKWVDSYDPDFKWTMEPPEERMILVNDEGYEIEIKDGMTYEMAHMLMPKTKKELAREAELARIMNMGFWDYLKEDIIKLIQKLPDDATLEDIQYHLFVKQKLLRAEEQIKAGKTIPHEEVMEKARKKWFK